MRINKNDSYVGKISAKTEVIERLKWIEWKIRMKWEKNDKSNKLKCWIIRRWRWAEWIELKNKGKTVTFEI